MGVERHARTQASQLVVKYEGDIKTVLPKMVDRDQFAAIAVSVANSSDLSECTPASVLRAIYTCAKLGLSPDPIMGHVAIIPRKFKNGNGKYAQVMMMYQGFVNLAERSGSISSIQAEVVRENDHFKTSLGTDRFIEHIPYYSADPKAEPGPLRLAYCTWYDRVCKKTMFTVVDSVRIEAAKNSSGYGSLWRKHPVAMMQKTAVREAAKLWFKDPNLSMVQDNERLFEDHEPQKLMDPTPDKETQVEDHIVDAEAESYNSTEETE